jgi:hypothetical protein
VEWEIVFDGGPQDLTVTTSGAASVEGFERFLEEVLADPRYRPGSSSLIDHRELDASALTPASVRAIADIFVRRDSQIGPGYCALVMGEPYKYGLARMWQAYCDDHLGLHTRVFYSLEDARDWLRETLQ